MTSVWGEHQHQALEPHEQQHRQARPARSAVQTVLAAHQRTHRRVQTQPQQQETAGTVSKTTLYSYLEMKQDALPLCTGIFSAFNWLTIDT